MAMGMVVGVVGMVEDFQVAAVLRVLGKIRQVPGGAPGGAPDLWANLVLFLQWVIEIGHQEVLLCKDLY